MGNEKKTPIQIDGVDYNLEDMTEKQQDKVQWPAVLVLARYDAKGGKVRGFVDDKKILESDHDLAARLAIYDRLEQAGALPYTYTLAALAEAENVLAEQVAYLEMEHGLDRPKAEAQPEE